MKKRKNQLDEMQEQKLLHIERRGCWFAFWALLISIFLQQGMFSPVQWKTYVGEWLIFMCLALYLTISCIRNGIWDRTFRPSLKTNFWISMIGALISGAVFGVISYVNYDSLPGSIATFVFFAIMIFIMCMIALSISLVLYRKRVDKLEKEEEDV